MALELLALIALRGRSNGLTALDLAGNLSAGALLLLAVRSALTGEPWTTTAAFLAASFPAHVFDLWRRWNRAR